MTEEELMINGRSIYELAYQLGRYVGPNTESRLADFLIREAKAAGDLANEIVRLTDKVEGLSADLDSAVEVAFKRGATDWVRLNYPDHYARLLPKAEGSKKTAVTYEGLSDRQRRIVDALYGLDADYAASFNWISETSGIYDDNTTRLITRKLARIGITEYVRGLLTEEGLLAGSGYRLTRQGRSIVEA